MTQEQRDLIQSVRLYVVIESHAWKTVNLATAWRQMERTPVAAYTPFARLSGLKHVTFQDNAVGDVEVMVKRAALERLVEDLGGRPEVEIDLLEAGTGL